MKTIQQDVLEVAIYGVNGKFLNNLNITKEVQLKTQEDKEGNTYLYVQEACQDLNMLELLGEKIVNNVSDFEKDSFTTPDVNLIRFSNNTAPVKLKVVGTGIDYNLKTLEIEHDIKIISPKVELIRNNEFTFGAGEVQQPTYKFKVLPFDDDSGDLYEMQFKKRKDQNKQKRHNETH